MPNSFNKLQVERHRLILHPFVEILQSASASGFVFHSERALQRPILGDVAASGKNSPQSVLQTLLIVSLLVDIEIREKAAPP
jgi:hypothetical protein